MAIFKDKYGLKIVILNIGIRKYMFVKYKAAGRYIALHSCVSVLQSEGRSVGLI